AVPGPALLRPIEIDDVQIGGALLNPALRHGGGIAAEDGFLAVIALSQPHTLAAAHIDGRQYQHGVLPIRTRPARLESERAIDARRFGIRVKRKLIEPRRVCEGWRMGVAAFSGLLQSGPRYR